MQLVLQRDCALGQLPSGSSYISGYLSVLLHPIA
jgi:hypothetical protein